MKTLRILPLLAATLLAACGDPDPSSSFPTERIYARYVAEAREDGTSTMTATFLEDQQFLLYEGIYLDGGDAVVFRVKEEQVVLPGGTNVFVADLVSGVVEDTRFEFDLQRPSHKDAPGSFGTLPAPMSLQWPEAGSEYSIERDDVTVFWSNAGQLDAMWLRVTAQCADAADPQDLWMYEEDFTVSITGDPGLASIDLSDHIIRTEGCRRYDAVVTLVRAREGHVDTALAPDETTCGGDDQPPCRHLGYVSVRQVRPVAIVLRP